MGSPAGNAGQGDPGQQQQNQDPPQNQGEPGQQQPGQSQPSQQSDESAVAKAYDKLRQVEEREKQKDRELKQKNQQLTEAEQKAQRADTLEAENTELRGQLQQFAAERIAQMKGFVDSEAAVATLLLRKVDISDRDKATKALDDLAAEKQGLTNGGGGGQLPPSGGPINPVTQRTPAGDAGMNQIIRQRAGRA
jgi:hypothetical protein